MSKHTYDFMGKGFNYIRAIERRLGAQFQKKQLPDGVIFDHVSGNRFLKLIDAPDTLVVHFSVPVPSPHKERRVEKMHFHDQENPHHVWVYKGPYLEEILELIDIALAKYDPHAIH